MGADSLARNCGYIGFIASALCCVIGRCGASFKMVNI